MPRVMSPHTLIRTRIGNRFTGGEMECGVMAPPGLPQEFGVGRFIEADD